MTVGEWSKDSVDYGRKLVDSGLEGAQEGEEAFLHGEPLAPFLGKAARRAITPTVVGICLGAIGGRSRRRPTVGETLAFAVIGGAIGFALGLGWHSRRLASSVACGAMKKIEKTRDEHWFEQNPIDYA